MVNVAQGQAISSAASKPAQKPASTRCSRCSLIYLIEGVGSRLTISTEVMAIMMPDHPGLRARSRRSIES